MSKKRIEMVEEPETINKFNHGNLSWTIFSDNQ